MNKFKFYTVAAVLASSMALSSCGDSFLNSDPASKVLPEQRATP